MSTYTAVRDARLHDPSCQFWEQKLIRELDSKDILDVMYGFDDIRQLFTRKYAEVTGRDWT